MGGWVGGWRLASIWFGFENCEIGDITLVISTPHTARPRGSGMEYIYDYRKVLFVCHHGHDPESTGRAVEGYTVALVVDVDSF